ncbi:hypothetical protein BOW52_05235 [Solemya elarraichensis gill symbiont]|uniref:Acetyltransferase n=2 Tax=Solemya elarraichensis gill symbiont TaxID=1918949 RepID=A0A1T2L7L3_9GAMM|nr:hypothetical protein BOW52_05235 [Solemya elarraichensis gill symbiont]
MMRGVEVDKTATIDWSVSIDPARGKITIGPDSSLDRGVILRAYGGSITIGSDCTVNPYSLLYGGGGLKIGNGVRIAAHTVIVPSNHIYSDPEKYIYSQGESKQGITIEDDVWIGAGVRILDGIVIGKGSVIGAGSVVTKSTEPYSIVVGVPARQISTRLRS